MNIDILWNNYRPDFYTKSKIRKKEIAGKIKYLIPVCKTSYLNLGTQCVMWTLELFPLSILWCRKSTLGWYLIYFSKNHPAIPNVTFLTKRSPNIALKVKKGKCMECKSQKTVGGELILIFWSTKIRNSQNFLESLYKIT